MLQENILEQILAGVELQGDAIGEAVETRVRAKILTLTPREILTFCLPSGKIYAPPQNLKQVFSMTLVDYAKAFACFISHSKLNGEVVDTIVTKPIADTADAAFSDAVLSAGFAQRVAQGMGQIETGIVLDRAVREELRRLEEWLQESILDTIEEAHGDTLKIKLIEMTAQQLADFFHSAAGAAVLKAVVAAAATAAGSAAITHAVTIALQKVAVKKVLIALGHKIGIAAAISALVYGVVLPHLPAFVPPEAVIWMAVLVILAALFAHDVKKLPSKLADKVPGQIRAQIVKAWPEKSREVMLSVLRDTVAQQIEAGEARRRTLRYRIRAFFRRLFDVFARLFGGGKPKRGF